MSKPSFWLRLDLRFCEIDRNRVRFRLYWRRNPDNVNVAALFCFKSVMQKSLAANHRDLPLQFCAEQARIRITRLLPEPVSPRPSQHIVRKWRHRHSMPFATRLAAQSSAGNAVADLGPSQTATVGNVAQVPAIKLSTEMAKAFKESFAALQHEVDWLADSPRFEQKARATLDSTCDRSVLQQLSDFTRSSNAPSALLLTGLPREDNLPPTIGETPIPKENQLSEALMFAIGSLWGHAFAYEGMQQQGCIKDITASKTVAVNSTTELQMHRDYPFVPEHAVPHVRLLLCMRPDKARLAETLICDNRRLVDHLTAREIQLLRTHPITFVGPNNKTIGGKHPTITGPESDPVVNLFDAGFKGMSYRADNPAAVDAYHKAARVAAKIAIGVKLKEGQMLIINNFRATHGRTESSFETDGYGRWLKVASVRADIDPNHRFVAMH